MITIHDQIVDPESGEVVAEPGVITDDLGIDRVLNLVFQFPGFFKVLAFLPGGYIAGADNPFDFEVHHLTVPPDTGAVLDHFVEKEEPL